MSIADHIQHADWKNETEPVMHATLRLAESGTLMAVSYCNIHGLWESQQEVTVR